MLLNDRVAIGTGAGRGIGLGIADTFGQQGARVIIGEIVEARGRDAAEKLKDRGWNAEAFFLDVTQSSSCRDLTEKVIADYGRIDILVNNAGVFILHKSEDMPEEDWRLQTDVYAHGSIPDDAGGCPRGDDPPTLGHHRQYRFDRWDGGMRCARRTTPLRRA